METLEKQVPTIAPSDEILEEVLRDYMAGLSLGPEIALYLVVSGDRRHFMLMHEGWEGDRRLHGAIVHAEVRDGKIWVHYDGSEAGITDDLVRAGVPKSHIVLGFQPPYARQHTGYAIA
jgi:hypothetical protein